MTKTLIANKKKYNGKYVAFKSFNENTVVASGKNPVKVIERAKKAGFFESVIAYIPNKNEIHAF